MPSYSLRQYATAAVRLKLMKSHGAGLASAGRSDGGTATLGAFLTWLSDRTSDIFVVSAGDEILHGRFYFDATGFYAAAGSFDTDRYTNLRDLFVDKYGPPTSKGRTGTCQIGIESEYLAWISDTVVISLQRFGPYYITEGTFNAMNRAEYDRRVQTWNAQRAEGKAGL